MIKTEFHTVEHEGVAIINRVQDCEPAMVEAATLRAAGATGAGGDMHHLGRFPKVLIERYCNTRGITFRDWISDTSHAQAMLNDPDLSAFRIHTGKVG